MAYNRASEKDNAPEMIERVVYLNRVSKTVKGGRVMKFSALVVVGDGKGTVGYGLGKAAEVSEAILKGIANAKKNLQKVVLAETTIPHEVIGIFGAGKVLLKPAPVGTGVLAGGYGSCRYQQHSRQVPALQQPAERCQGNDAGPAEPAWTGRGRSHPRQERRRNRWLRRIRTWHS